MLDLKGLRAEPMFLGLRDLPDDGPVKIFLDAYLKNQADNHGSSHRGPKSFFYEAQYTLRNKDKLLKKQPTPEEQQMMQQQQQERQMMLQAELGDKMADIRKKNADALGKEEKALQTAVETELLQTNPPPEKVSMI